MDSRSRNVIVLFAQRRVKEEIWWRSKDSPICKTEGIRFAEMLPQLMNNINSFIHLCLQIRCNLTKNWDDQQSNIFVFSLF
ncbi:hypothetical protein QQF64_018490 [Cirrhinus molitorella]|uniref:Uncharacterized protein n=1 Tax=Cirrhinus molitorella TaxID=172907 RepID=A0ABR3LG72_9TELE